jgi:hypothetical protein
MRTVTGSSAEVRRVPTARPGVLDAMFGFQRLDLLVQFRHRSNRLRAGLLRYACSALRT